MVPSRPTTAPACAFLLAAVVLGACAPATSTVAASTGTTASTGTVAPTSTAASSTTTTAASAASSSAGTPGAAADVLATLLVKGRAPKTGYDRGEFGQAWADVDRNGCDTRNDVLRRDLTAVQLRPGTRDCVVLAGTLADPYSGTSIAFVRGAETSSAVQVDHVVALSDAWQTGARGWDTATRTAFANDPAELLAVDGPLNQQKGDGDAATWLPPATGFRCAYVARQIAVKARYGLWVKPAERDAMVRVLATCPGQPLPAAGAATTSTPSTPPAPRSPATDSPATDSLAPELPTSGLPAPVSAESLPWTPEAEVHYANCAAVRSAGAAPLHRGEPGYAAKLDRDDDGTACE